MGKIVVVLLEYEGKVYKFGQVKFNDTGDIYYNFGTRWQQNHNLHDSYHASHEVHQGRQSGEAGSVFQYEPPGEIAAPIQFGSTTGKFTHFKIFGGERSRNDALLSFPGRATHPVVGVYLEPRQSYMVRRAYKYLPPPDIEVLSVQTRRLTKFLDVTVVGINSKMTMSGSISFDQRMTSAALSGHLKGAKGWCVATPAEIRVQIEAYEGRLQDLSRKG